MIYREPSWLIPTAQNRYFKLVSEATDLGIRFNLTRTACTWDVHVAYAARGRKTLPELNKYELLADIPLTKTLKENRIVTWTMSSKHVISLAKNDALNGKVRAFDIVIFKNDRVPVWDPKADTNHDDLPDYKQLGKIWQGLGGIWGGTWGDLVHFEVD